LLRKPGNRFVIAIDTSGVTDVPLFQSAARLLLYNGFEPPPGDGRNSIVVESVPAGKERPAELISRLGQCRQAVLFFNDKSKVHPEVLYAVDGWTTLISPAARHFEAAGRWLGLTISKTEASLLATKTLHEIRAAIRPGRPLARTVQKLMAEERRAAKPALFARLGDNTLEHLAGYGDAKEWGLRLATDLALWKRGQLKWDEIDRGVLLNGPPGCGKTSFASALANSCGVALVSTSSARWQAEGHLGDMLKAMRASFAEARAKSPSILFIDEFDSFGSRSAGTDHSADYKRQVINGLLECLDPLEGREGLIVVGATNHSDAIDLALLRPGRLERIIEISLPDEFDRVAILRHHLSGAKVGNLASFVKVSEGWSGADIENLAREARRNARRAGREVTFQDVVLALPPRVEFTREELTRLAIHEAGHAIAVYSLRPDTFIKVSIGSGRVAGTESLGHTSYRENTSAVVTSSYYSDTIAILMAGVAAERLVYGEHSTGAGGDERADLAVANDVATMMERSFAFGDDWLVDTGTGSRPLETLRQKDPDLRRAVKQRLDIEFNRAFDIVSKHRAVLDQLSSMLVERLELNADDIHAIWLGKVVQP
jgi:SpoVK/Ycf46/Vps4 family AAA+-type ATPase